MADVTGRIGDQDVALDNAATEATLKDILSAMKGQAAALSKLTGTAGQAGVNPQAIASANQGMKDMGAAATAGSVSGKVLGAAMNGLSKGAMLLGGVLGDIVAGGIQTGKNLMDLAGKMLDGGGRISDVMGAFKDLPLGIGMVAGMFQKLMQMQEAELDTYRQLTKSGVNLGGTLTDVRATALAMGTTLEGFAKLVGENSTLFANLGGSVNDGAKNFVNLSKDIRNSEIGKNLQALGYSIDDINSSTASYLKMTGGRTAEEMKNTKALTEGAGNYMKQLDMLASITGQSREQQEKALAEQTKNAAYQNYLNTLDEKGREKATLAMQAALAKGGKGAADALQSKLLGLPPLTDEAKIFESMAGDAAGSLNDYVDAVKDSNKGVNDVNKATAKLSFNLAKEGEKIGSNFGGALIAGGGAIGQFASLTLAAQTEMKNRGIKTQEDYEKFMASQQNSQEARNASSAAKAAEAENAFKALTSKLYESLMPILGQLTGNATELSGEIVVLAEKFVEFIKDNMPAIQAGFRSVVDFIKDLFSPEGREKVGKQIAEGLGKLLQMAWDSFSLFGGKKSNAPNTAENTVGVEGSMPMADGGILKAKTGGQLIKAAEVGMNEAFVPLPDGNKIPVNLDMKMPQMTDLTKEFQSFKASFDEQLKKSTGSSTADIGGMISGIKDNLFGKSNESSSSAPDMSSKDLLAELQTLNKQTAQMISFMRETTDFSRRNLDAIRGLNGNLLI